MTREEKKHRREIIREYRRFMAIKAPAHKISAFLNKKRMGVDWGGSTKGDMAEAFVVREYRALDEGDVEALETEFGTRMLCYQKEETHG